MAGSRRSSSTAGRGKAKHSGRGKRGAGPRHATNAQPRSVKDKLKTFAKFAVIGVISLMVIAVVAVVIAYQTIKLPDPNSDFQSQTTFIYYNDGKEKLASLAVQNRIVVDYDSIPQSLKDAVVAAENRSFWDDSGISITGMARSALVIATGGDVQGGSTITQQYIKVMYLSPERTVSRKFKELLLAYKLNREVSKEEILAGYLNTIYFGRGAYGVEAASRAYFNKSVSALTTPESVVLAAVLNSPSTLNPSSGQDAYNRLKERYGYVLDGMKQMGKITDAQYHQYLAEFPTFPEVPINNRYAGPNGFLVKMVENELSKLGFSEQMIHGGGLQVTTTFDKKLQDAAISAVDGIHQQMKKKLSKNVDPSQVNFSLASVDTNTGAVLALYGGADFGKNSRNWATTPRMAGSTFKPYALVAGLKAGYSLDDTFRGNSFVPNGDSEPVRNEFGIQYGTVTLRKATIDSINTAFVDMVQDMPNGPQEVISAANQLGVPTEDGWDANNRISLGTAEVSPLSNAAGYAAFANGGYRRDPFVIQEVKDANGNVIYSKKASDEPVLEPRIASDVNQALVATVESGTGSRAQSIGHPAGGKTGTAGVGDKVLSAWFVGYTRDISTSVMAVVGDSGIGDLDPYKRPGDGTFFGGTYPTMVWADYMKVAVEGREVKNFDVVDPSPSARPTMSQTTPTPSVTEEPSRPQTPAPSPDVSPTANPDQPGGSGGSGGNKPDKPTPSPTPEPGTDVPKPRPSGMSTPKP